MVWNYNGIKGLCYKVSLNAHAKHYVNNFKNLTRKPYLLECCTGAVVSGVNNLRIALGLFALLGISVICGAQSNSMGSIEESNDSLISSSNSAISLNVHSTPDDVSEVDVVTFTYDVYNRGTSKLCSIVINNSLSGIVPLEPFDLESGENATLTAEYVITSEDRELLCLVNDVIATGHSCEDGTATATAGSRSVAIFG